VLCLLSYIDGSVTGTSKSREIDQSGRVKKVEVGSEGTASLQPRFSLASCDVTINRDDNVPRTTHGVFIGET